LLGAAETETDTESRCQLPNSYKRFGPRLIYILWHPSQAKAQTEPESKSKREPEPIAWHSLNLLNANYLALMMSPTFGLSEIRRTRIAFGVQARTHTQIKNYNINSDKYIICFFTSFWYKFIFLKYINLFLIS